MIYSWHKSIWDRFSRARLHDHLPHALLLYGDEGIGKLELAKSVVKSLLCTNTQDEYQSCNQCQACKTYESGANPDYLHIDLLEGKQQIGVDQVRQLSTFLNYTRSLSTYRVVLLNPAERMNKNAANSLLKSLEEPTQNTVIILVAAQLASIIPTIKSRCQLLAVQTPSQEKSLEWIDTHAPDLVDPEIALKIANGKPLHAIDINSKTIESKDDLSSDILELCLENKSTTEIAKKWEKFNLGQMLDWQILWVQDYIKNTNNLSDKHQKIKEKMPPSHQWELYQQLISCKKLIHTSVNPLMFVESMLLFWLKASQCHIQHQKL